MLIIEKNAIIKKDLFPLPRTDDVLDVVGQNSSLPSTWHLGPGKLKSNSSPRIRLLILWKTKYEWNRLQFGLTDAPGTLQRTINHILQPVIGKICIVYLDYIIIFSKSDEEHVNNLKVIFDLFEKSQL